MGSRYTPSHAGTADDHHALGTDGLTVRVRNGYEKMLMSEEQLCDDVLATVPKLKVAYSQDTYGRKWKACKRKNGVDLFELVAGGCDDRQDDLDLAHALVAKTEIHCHLNEVLNVVINRDSSNYESTMKALCGRSFKDGRQLFQHRRPLATRVRTATTASGDASSRSSSTSRQPQTALLTVNLNTLRPKLTVKFSARHKRTQTLAFASCTVQYPSKDRAYHLIKTLPKQVHDDLVSSDDRTCLRREMDHIAMGIDIRSTIGGYSSSSHTTRLFAHAYASSVKPAQYGRLARSNSQLHYSPSDLARHRNSLMNPEARTVLETLAKSLREYETIIRRRRFGFQTFVFFPTYQEDTSSYKSCSICDKKFSFFRKDFFCQLCGHTVCGECSRLYDVEICIGEVRSNRCCIQCVVRVDACVFDDEDIVPALAPVLVDASDDAWQEAARYQAHEEDAEETMSIGSVASSQSSLYSTDPMERSMALERLAQLLSPTSSVTSKSSTSSNSYDHGQGQGNRRRQGSGASASSSKRSHHQTQNQKWNQTPHQKPKPVATSKRVLRDLENHLAHSMRHVKDQYQHADELPMASKERDYLYEYDAHKVSNPNIPLAPVPSAEKEHKRLELIAQSGVLQKDYDHSALNLIAQLAAKKLNCPIGFVSVVDDKQFHAVGNHNLPVTGKPQPRDENMCMHGVYAESPLIVKNPQRDMRFAQMDFVAKMGVKFYAGFPIKAPDGSVMASLCTGDVRSHENISTQEYAAMEALSKLAADLMLPPSSSSSSTTTRSMHHQPQYAMAPRKNVSSSRPPVMPVY